VSRLTLLIVICCGAAGQKLEIPQVAIDRGGTDIFRIVLNASAQRPISALQWELVYPDSVQIDPSSVVAGEPAEKTSKSVVCRAAPSRGTENALACLIAGGVSALSTGTIAIVRFSALSKAPKGSARIELRKIVGASTSTERVDLENASGTITIR